MKSGKVGNKGNMNRTQLNKAIQTKSPNIELKQGCICCMWQKKYVRYIILIKRVGKMYPD